MIYLQVWAITVFVYLAAVYILSLAKLYFRPTQTLLLLASTSILAYSALSGGLV